MTMVGSLPPFMRHTLDSSHQVAMTASAYLRGPGRCVWNAPTAATKLSTHFPYAFSITGVSATMLVTAHSSTGTVTIEVHWIEPGSSAAVVKTTTTSPSITGNGTYSWSMTQNPGIDTVTYAGIALYAKLDSGAFTFKAIASAELDFDAP